MTQHEDDDGDKAEERNHGDDYDDGCDDQNRRFEACRAVLQFRTKIETFKSLFPQQWGGGLAGPSRSQALKLPAGKAPIAHMNKEAAMLTLTKPEYCTARGLIWENFHP